MCQLHRRGTSKEECVTTCPTAFGVAIVHCTSRLAYLLIILPSVIDYLVSFLLARNSILRNNGARREQARYI